jgi:membrane protein YqaA with SNARE-associated domain
MNLTRNTSVIGYVKSLYTWMGSWAHSPYACPLLGLLFYIEAILFIPTEPMLIVYCIQRRNKAFLFGTIATIASVLGGLTGYAIGSFLWDIMGEKIIHNFYINFLVTPERFMYISHLFARYEWAALLIAGIPPIPYKAVTLTAGFCKLPLLPFIACSLIVRGARFYLIAYTVKYFGVYLKSSIDKWFVPLAMISACGICFIMYRWLS